MNTVVMPKMGDTMEEGKILNWHKQVGDTVEKGEALAEVETEKVNIEAEAFASGTLRKILVQEGQTVPVGTPIALVGTPDEPIPSDIHGPSTRATNPEPGSQPEAAPAQDLPQPVAQPLTAQGHTRPEQPVPAGQVSAPAPNGTSNGVTNGATANGGRVFISPIARRIAQEHNVDVGHLQGSGPGGRIVREDIEAVLSGQYQQYTPVPTSAAASAQPSAAPQQQQQAPAAAAAQPATPAAAPGEEVEAVPLSNMRRTIARRLQQSMQTAPHFYVTISVDATRLGQFREAANEYASALPEPVKLSLNDVIVKGVALALARSPEINVSFDGERLLRKKHINIGIAVALEQGLIVPVIRDADKRGVLDIARESRRLVEAARTGKLKPEEFQGGTFSISNLGMFGVEEFTAVINPPESAILAVGAAIPTPVVVDGQVVVRDVMKVTLSVDHRAIDGAQAARFLQVVKQLLEQPMGMLL